MSPACFLLAREFSTVLEERCDEEEEERRGGLRNPHFAWSTTGGPSGAEFIDCNAATTVVRDLRHGTYLHRVTVTVTGDGAAFSM